MSNIKYVPCQFHGKECVDYCENCNVLICSLCNEIHYKHKIIPLKVLLQQAKINLDKDELPDIIDLKELQNTIIKAQNQIDISQVAIENKLDNIRTIINRTMDAKKLFIQCKNQIRMILQLNEVKADQDLINNIVGNSMHQKIGVQMNFDFYKILQTVEEFTQNLDRINLKRKSQRFFDHNQQINCLLINPGKNLILTACEGGECVIKQLENDQYEDSSLYSCDFAIKGAKFFLKELIILQGPNTLEAFNYQLEFSSYKLGISQKILAMDCEKDAILISCNNKTIQYFQFQENYKEKIQKKQTYNLLNQNACCIKFGEMSELFALTNDFKLYKLLFNQKQLTLIIQKQSASYENYFNQQVNSDAMAVNRNIICLAQAIDKILIFETTNLTLIKELISQDQRCISLCISSSSQYVYSGYEDGFIKIWDIKKMQQIQSIKESRQSIRQIYQDKETLYSISDEPCLIIN